MFHELSVFLPTGGGCWITVGSLLMCILIWQWGRELIEMQCVASMLLLVLVRRAVLRANGCVVFRELFLLGCIYEW